MINRKIMDLLRSRTGKSIQAIYHMIAEERKKRGYAVRKETAAYILAGDIGIDIAKYLSDEELAKVSVRRDVGTPGSFSKPAKPSKQHKKTTERDRVYDKGQSYDFYRDLQSIIKSARREVFIVDAWLDEEIFNLYVEKLKPNTIIKILTKDPKGNFMAVAKKFKIRPGYSLEVREHQDVHDRVFLIDEKCYVSGQSVKDAGKKPTYLVKIDNKQMENIINEMWNNGTVMI